jgi:hypothetical protein
MPPRASAGGSLAQALLGFGAIFAALWLVHFPLLRLPYFWDEAGYFIPAGWDILRGGELIPHTTLSNAHPPLVMLWLALWWKVAGYSPLVTRTAMVAVAAFGFTGLWLLARRVASASVATATVVLTALSPTVYSQSTMAQLDIAAFALVVWMVYSHVSGRHWQAIAFAALAGVAKETTVAVTLTLFAADLAGCGAWQWASSPHIRQERADVGHQFLAKWCMPRRTLAQCAGWLLALLPLAGWYGYHWRRTGHVFGNPDYLRYNVGATVTPLRIALAGLMRLWHATGYMNLFVLTAAALLLLWNARQPGAAKPAAPAIAANVQALLALVVLAQMAEFSVVGGALLARYMIPAIPLVILLAVNVVRRYAPGWKWWIAGCAAAFVVALVFNPPWFISPEDNLTWARYVRMHQEAARYVEQHYGEDRILTAWTASDELNRPFLGYVDKPLSVVRLENFTAEEILRAQQQPESFDVVVAFSTKYEPPRGLFRHIPGWTYVQTRYFDFHQDLAAATIARMLHGRIVWQRATTGEWIAVIEVEKTRNAEVALPALR